MKLPEYVCIVLLSMFAYVCGFGSRFGARHSSTSTSRGMTMSDTVRTPEVKSIDKESNVAKMVVTLSGEQTQKAFQRSCDLFNEEVKARNYKVSGFRPGSKLPPSYLYKMFGEDRVKALCGTLMSEEIQDECEKTGLLFVGRGRITAFNEAEFTAGKPHTIEIECDLWPEITYTGENGYKGLKATVTTIGFDDEKYEQVKLSILDKYKDLKTMGSDYKAQMGDVVVANMQGFEKAADGSRGAPLPAVASGDSVDIILEKGKFMEGLVEGVEGAVAGETRMITVKFPVRTSGAGVGLSGKEALFELEVREVKTKSMPEWDETLAGRIREGLTLAALEEEVKSAVQGESESQVEVDRNDALATALLEVAQVSKVPESLVDEQMQGKFQGMIMDFKEQGSTEEQLMEMASEASYNKYKEISRPNVEKVVKLGMIFRDIAEKEGISVTEAEVKEQYDLICAQARQKGEQPPDEKRAADEIENVLLRKKVFDNIAGSADITWKDLPTGEE